MARRSAVWQIGVGTTPAPSRPPAPTWTPADLGASLLAQWDAERADLVTQSGGLVSSWKDTVGALDLTATTTARPTYSATGFNGRPVLIFDGIANSLAGASVFPAIPTGATPGEVWALADQAALVADTNLRPLVAYGGSAAAARSVNRQVVTGANRAAIKGGNGTSSINAGNPAVDFSGRHIVRAIFRAGDVQSELDGTPGTLTAGVNATATTRFKVGSDQNASPSTFFQGGLNTLIFTALLDATQAGQMYAYLGGRV